MGGKETLTNEKRRGILKEHFRRPISEHFAITFVDENEFDKRSERNLQRVNAVAELVGAIGNGRLVAQHAGGHLIVLGQQRRRRHSQADVVQLRRKQAVIVLHFINKTKPNKQQ